MKGPLISITIPTRNSEKTIKQCLESIAAQTYRNYEIIIVDGHSTDRTMEIAKEYTERILQSSASLPAARNLGFSKAKGQILVSIDSDMILEKDLLKETAEKIDGCSALIFPEIGYGTNFMSRCKDLEKRCYLGDELMESTRAFSRKAFDSVNGYNETLHFGEDRDIHIRIAKKFPIGRTSSRILHNTEHLSFSSNLRKSYYYGKSLPRYFEENKSETREWFRPGRKLFINYYPTLLKSPLYAAGLLFIKGLEYAAGVLGFMSAKLSRR